jgi:hypothetical protein
LREVDCPPPPTSYNNAAFLRSFRRPIMRTKVCGTLALGFVLALSVATAADDDEMVTNPKYKFWASHKPGTTATYHEVTKFTGEEKDSVPGGKDEKTVIYKLLSVNKDKVVVQTTVIEEDYLGAIEQAPTKAHYPAKIKKANLDAVFQEFGVKEEPKDETVTVGKEEIKCKMLSGTQKKDGATITYKLYYSDSVPGGIVKRTRTTKGPDKFSAETTVMLKSFAGPKKDKKDKKEKDDD